MANYPTNTMDEDGNPIFWNNPYSHPNGNPLLSFRKDIEVFDQLNDYHREQIAELVPNWAIRGQKFLTDLPPSKYGTNAAALSDDYILRPDSRYDIDFCRYTFLPVRLGTGDGERGPLFEGGMSTYAYQTPRLRTIVHDKKVDDILWLASGPGLIYMLIGKATEEEEEEGFDFRELLRTCILDEIRVLGGPTMMAHETERSLLCRSHQSCDPAVLSEALVNLKVDFIYHVNWGQKARPLSFDKFDHYAREAETVTAAEHASEEDHVPISNHFDLAVEYMDTTGMHALLFNHGMYNTSMERQKADGNPVSLVDSYCQAPGLFKQDAGSLQSRPLGCRIDGVTKVTIYNRQNHVLRAHGNVPFEIPTAMRAARRKAYHCGKVLDAFIELLHTDAGWDMMGGLRVEVRVRALTMYDALQQVMESRVCDLTESLKLLGHVKYTPGPTLNENLTTSDLRCEGGVDAPQVWLPIIFYPMTLWLLHAARVIQAGRFILRGRDTKVLNQKHRQVLTDMYASIGHTIPSRRPSSAHALTRLGHRFWVWGVENDQLNAVDWQQDEPIPQRAAGGRGSAGSGWDPRSSA